MTALGTARRRGDGGDQHHAVHRRAAGPAHHLHDSRGAGRAAGLRERAAQQQQQQPQTQNKNKNDIEVDVNNKGVIFVDGTKTDDAGIYSVMYDASKKKPRQARLDHRRREGAVRHHHPDSRRREDRRPRRRRLRHVVEWRFE